MFHPERPLIRFTLLGTLALATASAPGCSRKRGPGNCPKTAPQAVKPPASRPSCARACDYFVYCQSARWTAEDEQTKMREQCRKDCNEAKPQSQEEIFFAGLKRCAVDQPCVPFGACLRGVVAKMRQALSGEPEEDPSAIYQVPVAGSPMLGPRDALVTIVVFADYECPFCGKGWRTMIKLRKLHPGKIRLVYKHYPSPNHPGAKVAAEAGACVWKQQGTSAFWKFHELAFASEDLSDATLARMAKESGADPAAVKKCVLDKLHQDALGADLKLGVSLGVSGTPAFYLNGKKITGAESLAVFEKAYAEALARAEQALKQGVKPAAVYEHLTRNGHTKPKYLKGKGPAATAPTEPAEIDPQAVFYVPVSRNDPALGPRDALVTLVEFTDYQCPASAIASQRLKRLLKELPKDVRLVMRNYPLPHHQDAALAAEAALAVRAQKGDRGYFAFHDRLFANQKDLSRPQLERFAKELGVDLARFKKALDDHRYKAQVDQDRQFGERMGINATPAFYINGRLLLGIPPTYEAFKAHIDAKIKAARELLKKGVKRAELYDRLIKGGKTKPVYKQPGPK